MGKTPWLELLCACAGHERCCQHVNLILQRVQSLRRHAAAQSDRSLVHT